MDLCVAIVCKTRDSKPQYLKEMWLQHKGKWECEMYVTNMYMRIEVTVYKNGYDY